MAKSAFAAGDRLAAVDVGLDGEQSLMRCRTFTHTVIDEDLRVAYADIHGDENGGDRRQCVLRRAVAWFSARGVTVERVPSDNGGWLPVQVVAP